MDAMFLVVRYLSGTIIAQYPNIIRSIFMNMLYIFTAICVLTLYDMKRESTDHGTLESLCHVSFIKIKAPFGMEEMNRNFGGFNCYGKFSYESRWKTKD